MKFFSLKPKPKQNNEDRSRERPNNDDFYRERLRQARWGFNLALSFASVSALITLVGICLLATGQVSRGLSATTAGAASTAAGSYCMKLAKDANDRLDKYGSDLDDGDSEGE